MTDPSPEPFRVLPAPAEVASSPAGDFGAFYRSTIQPLRAYLARVLGDHSEAQDVAQDAFLKTYEAINGQGRSIAKPRAFLFVTARRLAINFRLRRSSRMEPVEASFFDTRAGGLGDPAGDLMARQRTEAFDRAILALPPVCRQVLLLRLKENLSHAEIADALGIAPSTVAKHLSRAFKELRTFRPDEPLPEKNPPASILPPQ